METEFDNYRNLVESQKEELYKILAKIGLESDYAADISIPDENTPLAALFVATKIAAENLRQMFTQLQNKIIESERYAKTVELQNVAIQELSTPIIQLTDGILILPLIGFIDTSRASKITEQLLDEISSRQSEVIIIDLTGVYVIDTQVASHIIKTVQAAMMIGAKSIVTGISPENAQIMVTMGMTIPNIVTTGTLQAGLEHALSLTNRTIIKKDRNADISMG